MWIQLKQIASTLNGAEPWGFKFTPRISLAKLAHHFGVRCSYACCRKPSKVDDRIYALLRSKQHPMTVRLQNVQEIQGTCPGLALVRWHKPALQTFQVKLQPDFWRTTRWKRRRVKSPCFSSGLTTKASKYAAHVALQTAAQLVLKNEWTVLDTYIKRRSNQDLASYQLRGLMQDYLKFDGRPDTARTVSYTRVQHW